MLPPGQAPGTFTPVPEIDYVRTYARVAQVQLRAVLDALAEQIELLGEVPKASIGPGVRAGDKPKSTEEPDDLADEVEWLPASD
jgi:hypothetical protein